MPWTAAPPRCITRAAGTLFRFRTELSILLIGAGAIPGAGPRRVPDLGAGHRWPDLVLALRAAVDPPVLDPPGLVRDLPAPAAAGVLRDPHAHKVRAAVPDPVDPAHAGG